MMSVDRCWATTKDMARTTPTLDLQQPGHGEWDVCLDQHKCDRTEHIRSIQTCADENQFVKYVVLTCCP